MEEVSSRKICLVQVLSIIMGAEVGGDSQPCFGSSSDSSSH